MLLRKQLIPARGRKSDSAAHYSDDAMETTHPREGTEIVVKRRKARLVRKQLIPARGRKSKYSLPGLKYGVETTHPREGTEIAYAIAPGQGGD